MALPECEFGACRPSGRHVRPVRIAARLFPGPDGLGPDPAHRCAGGAPVFHPRTDRGAGILDDLLHPPGQRGYVGRGSYGGELDHDVRAQVGLFPALDEFHRMDDSGRDLRGGHSVARALFLHGDGRVLQPGAGV